MHHTVDTYIDSLNGRFNVSKPTRKFQGKVIAVDVEAVRLPNGHFCELEIVRHPGGAAIVALDDRQRVCLLRQYRYVADDWLWELPAGKIDPGEDPLQTAQRELLEETGLKATSWSGLGGILSSPGVFQETIHLYLAQGLSVCEPRHEQAEVMEVHWLDLQEAIDWAKTNQIKDAKSIAGLFRVTSLLI